MLLISTAAHAKSECFKLSLQIEDFCTQSLLDLDNNRSVEKTYRSCVANIPDLYESIISSNKSSNLYQMAKKACWNGTHSGRTNCEANARFWFTGCTTSFPSAK